MQENGGRRREDRSKSPERLDQEMQGLSGEVRGETLRRLLEMLVGLVLLCGVEVWGCGKQLRLVENVQMRAVRLFMGWGGCTHWLPCSLK